MSTHTEQEGTYHLTTPDPCDTLDEMGEAPTIQSTNFWASFDALERHSEALTDEVRNLEPKLEELQLRLTHLRIWMEENCVCHEDEVEVKP